MQKWPPKKYVRSLGARDNTEKTCWESYGIAAVFVVLCTLLLAVPASRNSREVQGIVKDPTGAGIPGATIRIVNPTTLVYADRCL